MFVVIVTERYALVNLTPSLSSSRDESSLATPVSCAREDFGVSERAEMCAMRRRPRIQWQYDLRGIVFICTQCQTDAKPFIRIQDSIWDDAGQISNVPSTVVTSSIRDLRAADVDLVSVRLTSRLPCPCIVRKRRPLAWSRQGILEAADQTLRTLRNNEPSMHPILHQGNLRERVQSAPGVPASFGISRASPAESWTTRRFGRRCE